MKKPSLESLEANVNRVALRIRRPCWLSPEEITSLVWEHAEEVLDVCWKYYPKKNWNAYFECSLARRVRIRIRYMIFLWHREQKAIAVIALHGSPYPPGEGNGGLLVIKRDQLQELRRLGIEAMELLEEELCAKRLLLEGNGVFSGRTLMKRVGR